MKFNITCMFYIKNSIHTIKSMFTGRICSFSKILTCMLSANTLFGKKNKDNITFKKLVFNI